MKKETTLYARPKILLPWVIIIAIVLLMAGIFAGRTAFVQKKYQKFVSDVPAAANVEDMMFYLRNDATLIFQSPMYYSVVVLSDQTNIDSLLTYAVGGNTLSSVFMPADTQAFEEILFTAISYGLDIRNLYVPKKTDKEFISVLAEKSPRTNVVVCKGGEEVLLKDAGIYVQEANDSLVLSLIHGNNTFLYAYDKKVGGLFDKQQADVTIMPFEVFEKSNLDTTYALFPEETVDLEVLYKKCDQYLLDYDTVEFFSLSDGEQVSFAISLTPTGRLLKK